MKHGPTRVSEVAAVAAVAAAVVTDLAVRDVGSWWNRHSLIGSLVSSALILAFTILVVNEVLSRRQVRERNRVAAVQALIVYSQVLRTEKALMTPPGERENVDVAGEVRALGSMVLVAAPALFDDPEARDFMDQAERFSAMLVRIGLARPGQAISEADRKRFSDAKDAMSVAVQPLLARLPRRDITSIEGDVATDQVTTSADRDDSRPDPVGKT